jgi:hypothetical protein
VVGCQARQLRPTEGAESGCQHVLMSTGGTGTLVWYYAVCPREAWLIAHQMEPEREFDLLIEGQFNPSHFDVTRFRCKRGNHTASSRLDLISSAAGYCQNTYKTLYSGLVESLPIRD